jgi:hypothetical protein
MNQIATDQPVSIPALISKIEAVAKATGRSTGVISKRLFGDGKRYKQLCEEGRGLTVLSYNKAWNQLDLIKKKQPQEPIV